MGEKYSNTRAGVGWARLLYGKLVPLPASFNGFKYVGLVCLKLLKVSESVPWVDDCSYSSNWSCDKIAFAPSSPVRVVGGDEAEAPGETGPGANPSVDGGTICW